MRNVYSDDVPPEREDCDPVGIVDIAERAGVSKSAVRMWIYRRSDFPPEAGRVNADRWWHWPDVDAWLRDNGLPQRRG